MNTEKKEKPGTTIYINDEALEALNNVEIETMWIKLKKNSEKITYLVNYYKESQK